MPIDVEKCFGRCFRFHQLRSLSQRVNRRIILLGAVLFRRGLQVGQVFVGFEYPC